MSSIKHCGNCLHGRITEGIKAIAEKNKIEPEKMGIRYCLKTRTFVETWSKCQEFTAKQ